MKQYEYNMDVAPDRLQLQNMVKNESESFKEYAKGEERLLLKQSLL